MPVLWTETTSKGGCIASLTRVGLTEEDCRLLRFVRPLLAAECRRNGLLIPSALERLLATIEAGAQPVATPAATRDLRKATQYVTTADGATTMFYMSTTEMAARLGCSPQAVTKRARSGSLPAEKTEGGEWRYPRDLIKEDS